MKGIYNVQFQTEKLNDSYGFINLTQATKFAKRLHKEWEGKITITIIETGRKFSK